MGHLGDRGAGWGWLPCSERLLQVVSRELFPGFFVLSQEFWAAPAAGAATGTASAGIHIPPRRRFLSSAAGDFQAHPWAEGQRSPGSRGGDGGGPASGCVVLTQASGGL